MSVDSLPVTLLNPQNKFCFFSPDYLSLHINSAYISHTDLLCGMHLWEVKGTELAVLLMF